MLHYLEITKLLKTLVIEEITDSKKQTFLNIECAFDIETTSIIQSNEKHAFMYIWQFGIGYGNPVYYGRTIEEFQHLLSILQDYLELSNNRILPCYVHNLGYEFQFIRKYLSWLDVFAVAERKPIKALCNMGVEFRDSYVLSGFSLANTAKNLTKHTVKKMVGDLDYSLIRHHATPLTDDEMGYCENDIIVVLAYINEQISICGDISRIPMTNTGRVRSYVRNYCYYKTLDDKKAGKNHYFKYRNIMEDLTLEPETYLQLKRAFMGGFTHANATYTGLLLHDVSSIDFTSSYPAVMLSEKFPMSRFKEVEITSKEQFNALRKNRAMIFDAKFNMIIQKITQESYLSESKCFHTEKATINNGRIFKADSISTTLTEVDLDIMEQCYSWESLEITNVRVARKGYLPKPIIHSILKLYQDKTQLKDVAGYEVEYMLSKGMLNSIYGMSVTDIVKDNSIYRIDWEVEKVNLKNEITDYNESKNRFLYYGWGLYVTAYARRNLWTGIISVGDDYVYSDTDSLKIMNYDKHKPYIKWFDDQIISKMVDMCKYYKFDTKLLNPKTKEGVEKMIGIWDYEGTYQNFKTLGAKRYLTDENGKLQLTVAGLSKKSGLEYMAKMCDNDTLKIFDMFNDNLHIPKDETGKMTHTYIDTESDILVEDYTGVKRHVNSKSGIHLESCEFTLSLNDQYTKFIKQLKNGYFYTGVKHE